MNITSFHPVIMTTKSEEIIELFEELGFERKHFTKLDSTGSTSALLRDEAGHNVDVSQVDSLPHDNHDLMSIRINVSDYDEAIEFFTAHGFTNPLGDGLITNTSSKGALLRSPSGFLVNIVKHIKKQ